MAAGGRDVDGTMAVVSVDGNSGRRGKQVGSLQSVLFDQFDLLWIQGVV